jgi:PAS domain-containing protein
MQAEQLASNAEAALSMLPTAIVLIDADQRVRWVNPAAFALLGQQEGLRITDDGELDPLLAAKSRRTCAVSGRRSPE